MKTAASPAFASLGLDPRILSVLAALGYEEPTPIQLQSVPPLLEGRDVLAQAATGTGKTAAFALPILHGLAGAPTQGSGPAALILVPTRELAMQLAEAVHRYGRNLGVRVLPVYGGASMEAQLRSLKRGVDVVVATPGRALDHVNRKTLRLDGVRWLVLDEADEMLDMGFAEDLEAILAATPAGRQTALFSATIPPRIASIAAKHLRNPVRITIAREPAAAGKLPKVRQTAYVVPRGHKRDALGRVLDLESPTAALVLCRTRLEVDDLTENLKSRGVRVEALHGGISQAVRDRVMKKLRAGTLELVVATDVAARGLDIGHLSHVVNYDVPSSPDVYVHRIGRTGRAGLTGEAISLVAPEDLEALAAIEKLINKKLERVLVPGFASAGAVATMVSAGAPEHRGRQGSRRPEHRPQQQKSQHATAPHTPPHQANPPQRPAQKPSDPIFSRPYEPGTGPVAVKTAAEPAAGLGKRRERPVASLFGGLKRA